MSFNSAYVDNILSNINFLLIDDFSLFKKVCSQYYTDKISYITNNTKLVYDLRSLIIPLKKNEIDAKCYLTISVNEKDIISIFLKYDLINDLKSPILFFLIRDGYTGRLVDCDFKNEFNNNIICDSIKPNITNINSTFFKNISILLNKLIIEVL